MTQFKRIASGQYADAASRWTISRDGGPTERHDRTDWLVKDASGKVVRVRPTKAEAEIAAHAALNGEQSERLTAAQAAERCGIQASTWRGYVARGYAPPADDPGDLNASANRRTPRWLPGTIERFRANRLGQGTRTDMSGGKP